MRQGEPTLFCLDFYVKLTLVIKLLKGSPGLCSDLPVGEAILLTLRPMHQVQVWKEEREPELEWMDTVREQRMYEIQEHRVK